MGATDTVTIAAVNGPAVGAGFDLALGCDLRIGSSSGWFAYTFTDLGIIPDDGGAPGCCHGWWVGSGPPRSP